jgi:retron-type reverse transcriptase
MEQDTRGIRCQSATYPKVQNLIHNVNEEALMEKHVKQSRRKATGVDGINKDAYGEDAECNIAELVKRMKRFSYKPQPVRRTYIPKANGKLRPLGIPSYEDRLVQGVMADLLNDVYEERFLDCSYGWFSSQAQRT